MEKCIRVVTKRCNCFSISKNNNGLQRGLAGEIISHPLIGMRLKDGVVGEENFISFATPTTGKCPPEIKDGRIWSAQLVQLGMDMFAYTFTKRNQAHHQCIIFTDAFSELPSNVSTLTSSSAIPGAIVMRQDRRKKDGHVRAGVVSSWSKQQVCVLRQGEYMFMIDRRFRVSVITFYKARLVMRPPTLTEMQILCKESANPPDNGF